MYRFFDVILSLLILIVTFPILLLVCILLFIETKSPIFLQSRLGRNQNVFTLIKFRTMKIGTPNKGSHEVSHSYVTKTGSFLRKFKIDELPQLLNVMAGSMSLVGPRPCLPSQTSVIKERLSENIFKVKPGITGLAQINEIDMSTPKLLAITDSEMIKTLNLKTYFRLLFLTALGKGKGDRVKQKK